MNALRFIRKVIFGLNQSAFAELVGRTQATVSRWEGGGTPTLDDMRAIRDAAFRRSINWNDDWFFSPPPQTERTAAVDLDDSYSPLGVDRVQTAGLGECSPLPRPALLEEAAE